MKKNNSRQGKVVHFWIWLVIMLFSVSADAGQFEEMTAEFEQFDNEIKAFETFRGDIYKEFELYKKIVDEEFSRYKKEILKYWDDAEVTQKKKFVEYSDDFKTKKVVDFEKGYIEISVIAPAGEKEVDKIIDKKLGDLVAEDTVVAFSRDSFAQGVEKRLTEAAVNVKKSKVKRAPIIADVVTGTATPSPKEVERAVAALKKRKRVRVEPSKLADREVVAVKIKLPSGHMKKKALSYLDDVRKYSKKRGLDPALVFAVIQTESAFNPMARSYVPAYGLMQIVPKSAGLDASKEVFGKEVMLSPSFLYNGENNINMGTAYLQILSDRYFKDVTNEESRLYCVIAAYNTGAGNVSKAFTGKMSIKKAASRINRLTPRQVYKTLIKDLPYKETKHYVQNVSNRMKLYEEM